MTRITRSPMYVVGAECVLTRRGGRLTVLQHDRVRASAPLTQVAEVVLVGAVGVTTPALHAMLANDVPLVLLSRDGRALGRLEPPSAPHIQVRQRQLALHADPEARASAGRSVVAGKIHNQDTLLRRRARRSSDPDRVTAAARRLAELERRVGSVVDLPSLVGLEGAAAAAYFAAVRLLLTAPTGFQARDRRRGDVANVLVNFCSALLRETVLAAVVAAGLDPCLSFLHQPARGRPTLVFDLMEEWRPVLLEPIVVSLVNLRAVTPQDVVWTDEGYRLTSAAAAATVARYRARLAAPARSWPPAPHGHSYLDRVRAQARAFRSWVLDEVDPYESFRWR